MNNKINRIVADLFSAPKAGEDWNVRIQRFSEEIKKIAEREDAIFGRFLRVLESFRTIIPDEKQRYHAALQALSATSKLSKDEIVNAVGKQLAELAAIQKSAMPAIPGQRNELKGWDARVQALQNEIAQLREKVLQLENDEKQIVTYIAARHQELDYVEKSLQQVFAAIGSDMTVIKNKIQEYTAENSAAAPIEQAAPRADSQPAPQPIPQPAPQPVPQQAADVPVAGQETAEQPIEAPEPPVPLDPHLQKKCPMCGGVMNFHEIDNLWMCYSCAHEESGKDGAAGNHQDRSTPAEPPAPVLSNEYQESPKKSPPSRKPESTKKKACPVCRMNMLWYPDEKAWRCNSCNYERKI